jgi:hypothetical protein
VANADDVYTGASAETLAAGRPGDVISYHHIGALPDAVRSLPGVGATLQRWVGGAWVVLYRSTDALGKRIGVSGVIIVPPLPWTGGGSRPVLALAHETVGTVDACAPSRTIRSGLYIEAPYVGLALAKGWAVALTDYEGLGTPGAHTYSVNRSEAHTVLDAVRAAARTPGTGLDAAAPVVIWGYSQGGGAAGAAAEAAPSYAPELDVRGVAAGGTVADLYEIGQANEGGAFYGFVAAASRGLDAAYPELDLRSYLNADGEAAYVAAQADAGGACDLASVIVGYAFKGTEDFTTSDPNPTPAWQRRFAENRLGMTKVTVPALLYHGNVDEVIPKAVGSGLRDRWCALGATVRWEEVTGDHLLGQAAGASAAMTWIADRFAGTPASSDCP